MNLSRLFFTLFLPLAALPALRAQETPAQWSQFAQELAAKNSRIETITCRFDQTRQSALLTQPAQQSGQFYYKHPERMRLSFANHDCVVLSGGTLLTVTNGRRNVVKSSASPMFREVERIMTACMRGDVEALTNSFTPSLQQNATQYLVTLTPRRNNRLKNILLTFSKQDMSLDALQFIEPSGDYLRYTFRDKRFNTPVEDTLFEIKN